MIKEKLGGHLEADLRGLRRQGVDHVVSFEGLEVIAVTRANAELKLRPADFNPKAMSTGSFDSNGSRSSGSSVVCCRPG